MVAQKPQRVACFFTAGYTELNAMQMFVKKINPRLRYDQKCPTGERKSRRAIENRRLRGTIARSMSGMTGEGLIDYVIELIQKECFQSENYDAILIEDDKDDRFLSAPDEDGTSTFSEEKWNKFKADTRNRIHEIIPDITVIFLFASPEVEGWFLLDWDHSFGTVYKNKNGFNDSQNRYFSHTFHNYVKNEILGEYYQDKIESFGFIDGKYIKLSECIQNALSEKDFLEGYGGNDVHPTVQYSKRNHGAKMLENIDPQIVERNCGSLGTSPYREGYIELQEIT